MENINGFIDLNRRIIDFVDKSLADKIERKSPLTIILSFLFSKSTGTIKAIDRLCSDGFGEDAGILARSLVESLINIEYLEKGDSELKCRLFIGHHAVDSTKYIQKNELLNDEKYLAIPEVKKTRTKEINGRTIKMKQKECERIKKETKFNPSKNRWSCLTIKDMATDTGLETYYYRVYWFLSQPVHPNASLINNYYGDNIKKFSEDFGIVSLQATINVYLRILTSVNQPFSLRIGSQIDEFNKDYLTLTGWKGWSEKDGM